MAMHDLSPTDGPREIDWGKTSADYAAWRPDYPPEFYDRLAKRGIGLAHQKILDLGTGIGFLAQEFARRGAIVTGVDISPEQIGMACERAKSSRLAIDYRVAGAEETGLAESSFDVVTASQSWLYFDRSRTIEEVKRVLTADGLLVTSHLCWLPRENPIARASEELVLKYNPDWTAADWSGEIPEVPSWARGEFAVVDRLVFDELIPFDYERWRGRIRACRGVGATLSPEEIARFDAEHERLLRELTAEPFPVLHRIDAHLMRPIG
jgi:SAM-dependent methyltransferase